MVLSNVTHEFVSDASQPQREDFPHNRSGGFVNDEVVRIRGVFDVAVGRVTADVFPSLAGGLTNGLDLAAGIACVQ